MTVVLVCAKAEIFKIVFYGQNDPKTVQKKVCSLVLKSSKINLLATLFFESGFVLFLGF